MAFKGDYSEEAYNTHLELFTHPMIDTSIYKKEYVSFRPISPLSKGSPIRFSIPGTSVDYKDLPKTRSFIRCKIIKSDGSAISEEDNVGFVNMPLAFCFRQVDVSLQQQNLSGGWD